MDFDTALAIRIGSASLFVLLGLAVAAIGRRTPRVLVLGVSLFMYGSLIVTNNISRASGAEVYLPRGLLAMAVGAAGIASAFALPGVARPSRAGWYGVVAGGLATGLAVGHDTAGLDNLYGFAAAPSGLLPFLRLTAAFSVMGMTAFVTASSAGAAIASRAPDLRRAAALAVSIGLWAVFQVPSIGFQPMSLWAFASTLALVAGLTIPWLVAAAGSGDRFASRMALVWPGAGVLAYLYLLAANSRADLYYDPWGLLGVCRLVGWAVLVFGIVKLDVLGVELPHFVVRRGAVAGGALALLFIVAQLAQNFFSAEFGLMSGGVIAGTFLFAASPLQKAFERMGERTTRSVSDPAPSAPHQPTPQQEMAFREAVQLALRDRHMTRDEEVHLFHVAEALGISAGRAMELRHEVETAKGVR